MSTSRLVIICFLLLFVGLATPTKCFSRTVYFDKSSYEPGESGVFSVTIEAEAGVDQTLWFTRLEIFFDCGNYWTSTVTEIEPGETKTINVTFPVPSSVSPGSHSYNFKLTWSLSANLEKPIISTSSSSIIAITEPTSDQGVYSWEFVVLMVAFGILIGVLIGVVITFVRRKSK